MNIINNHEELLTIAIGDIHGDFNYLRNKIKSLNISDTVLFQCGDFGVGFAYNDPREPKKEYKRLSDINVFLKKRKIFLYVVRGNHDNPLFFDGNHNFSNIIFMKDYDIVEIGNVSYLGIGGATSLDRKPNHFFNHKGRRENIDWWSNEIVVYNEELLSNIAGIDVVLTHTCPDFVSPIVVNDTVNKWCICDAELKQDLINERALMSKIYNKLNELNVIKKWYYGHFHHSNIQMHNTTTFKLLDVDEFSEIYI